MASSRVCFVALISPVRSSRIAVTAMGIIGHSSSKDRSMIARPDYAALK
jgi:hypothetical protein